MGEKFCKCGNRVRSFGQRNCTDCHNVYQRKWRSKHRLTPEQRLKDNARSYANVYKRKGLLIPEPCKCCGAEKTEMHHEDYKKPIDIVWLCRECHMSLHREKRFSEVDQVDLSWPEGVLIMERFREIALMKNRKVK